VPWLEKAAAEASSEERKSMPRHRSPREEIGEAKTALERINANCESSVHSRGAFHVLYLAI